MSSLPILKPRELLKILKRIGFQEIRQKGSHIFVEHSDGRTTVIPMHSAKTIGKGLIHSILHDIQVSPDDFNRIIKKK